MTCYWTWILGRVICKSNLSNTPNQSSQSNSWVMSTLLHPTMRSALGKPANRLYNPGTARPMDGSSWQIKYGDMSTASGKVYVDRVAIGPLEVSDQAVEAATNMSASFTKGEEMDGLLGLGATRLNRIKPQAQPTWFDRIKKNLAEPVFVSILKRHAAGAYDFGFIDKSKYKGELIWAPVNDPRGFWDFQVEGIQVGNGPIGTFNRNFSAVADTGSSLWYAPQALSDAYWSEVQGAQFSNARGGYTFPCSAKLPDIKIMIGGTNGKYVMVPGENLNYQSMGNTCYGGLQRSTDMPMSIFGDTFLKGLYVVFEHKEGEPRRIGLAQQA
jgi:aspergillopepsin I